MTKGNVMDTLGAYLLSIGKYNVLTPEEEYSLALRAKEGDAEAKEKLICHNLKLVVSTVRRMCNANDEILDMITAGNEGLIKAVDKFEPSKGFRFSTYATWWIRQACSRDKAETKRIVRLPVYLYELISKERKAYQALENKLGRSPDKSEVAELLQVPVEKIEELEVYRKEIGSLDINVGEDKETTFVDMIKDDQVVSPEESAFTSEMKREVDELMNGRLTEKERFVIERRYGFHSNPSTLEEIGRELGVSRERIRQIEYRALEKLRVGAVKNRLDEFIA